MACPFLSGVSYTPARSALCWRSVGHGNLDGRPHAGSRGHINQGVQRKQVDLTPHQVGYARLGYAEKCSCLCLGHALLANDFGQAHHQARTRAHAGGVLRGDGLLNRSCGLYALSRGCVLHRMPAPVPSACATIEGLRHGYGRRFRASHEPGLFSAAGRPLSIPMSLHPPIHPRVRSPAGQRGAWHFSRIAAPPIWGKNSQACALSCRVTAKCNPAALSTASSVLTVGFPLGPSAR